MNCSAGRPHRGRAFIMIAAAVLAVICSAAALTDGNAAGETSGSCGEDLTWTIDSQGNLTIEGSGPMDDFISGEKRWGGNTVRTVSIGDSVTSIGEQAFYECNSLTSVAIGNSVESIGKYAFWSCGFESVVLPDTLASIGEAAFFMCTSLELASIPDSVASIGINAFDHCTSLASVTVSDGNPAYSSFNGILFDKPKTTLILYPEGHAGSSYDIPGSVNTRSHTANR